MSTKAISFRNIFKKISIEKYFFKNIQLKAKLKKYFSFLFLKKAQMAPSNSFRIKYKNRCSETGRAKAYYRRFGICRNILRDSIINRQYSHVRKAVW